MKKIIVFDGLTACGKTTLLKKVEAGMKEKGIKVSIMDERNALRDLIDKLQIENIIRSDLPPITETLFWSMNQAYRVESELPTKKGDLILIDRYIYTPIVYQYLLLREKNVKLDTLVEFMTKPFGIPFPVPDLSLILLAPINVLKERFKKREKREMTDSEVKITKQALQIYQTLSKRFKNYVILDSNKSINSLYNEVEKLIQNKALI